METKNKSLQNFSLSALIEMEMKEQKRLTLDEVLFLLRQCKEIYPDLF